MSAFGSVIGVNRSVDLELATEMSSLFVEAIIAPDFDPDALALLQKKRSIRLVSIRDFFEKDSGHQFRYVTGGFLLQDSDERVISEADLTFVSDATVSQAQLNDLLFAFSMVKHVKSNAIVIAKNGQTIGVGAGQMSRVEAVELALKKAGADAKGAVMASDAFFPFKDSVELAAKHGIAAIIQPGGSKRDQESVDTCNQFNIAMAFTGVRHFKH